MNDQAWALRRMTQQRAGLVLPSEGPPAFVVASGKGGVGKSVISVLLGALLAERGQRVLLLEGDQNLGVLSILLGVRPSRRLQDLLEGTISPADLLTRVVEDLWLLPADSGAESLYALGAVDRARLHHRLNSLYDRFDAIIIDAGSGLDSVVRVASMRATRMIVVTVPEPAALIDAYAVMKIVHLQVPQLPLDVLVNRITDAEEGTRAFQRLDTACKRFLQCSPDYLGAVPEDEAIRSAVRVPRGLLERVHDSNAVQELSAIVDRLHGIAEPARVTAGSAGS